MEFGDFSEGNWFRDLPEDGSSILLFPLIPDSWFTRYCVASIECNIA